MTRSKKLLVACAALAGLYAGSITARAATQSTPDRGTKIASASDTDKGKHDCKGKNDCKGQGGCASSDNGCKGKNSCKGKGGCNTSDKAGEA